jgi:hypothetical protein
MAIEPMKRDYSWPDGDLERKVLFRAKRTLRARGGSAVPRTFQVDFPVISRRHRYSREGWAAKLSEYATKTRDGTVPWDRYGEHVARLDLFPSDVYTTLPEIIKIYRSRAQADLRTVNELTSADPFQGKRGIVQWGMGIPVEGVRVATDGYMLLGGPSLPDVQGFYAQITAPDTAPIWQRRHEAREPWDPSEGVVVRNVKDANPAAVLEIATGGKIRKFVGVQPLMLTIAALWVHPKGDVDIYLTLPHSPVWIVPRGVHPNRLGANDRWALVMPIRID